MSWQYAACGFDAGSASAAGIPESTDATKTKIGASPVTMILAVI